MKQCLLIGLAFALALSVCGAQSDYVQTIEKWRSDEEADLKKDDGWLTLAGLFWLHEGTNSVGAGSEFDVRLTSSFKKAKFGVIDFRAGKAVLRVEPGVDAKSGGQPVSTIELVSDETGAPTKIRTGSQNFYLIRREDRFGIRLEDNESPARKTFQGQRWFPIVESYRITARFEALPEPKELAIPNVLGGHFKMKTPGLLKFTLEGKEASLQPIAEDDGSLFIIFHDRSNGQETYSGGRFLHAEKPANGEVILDFNRAENPPCAFTPFATCPLPPPGNDLEISVKAGEKVYDH